jgi:hypothetical protein
MNLLYLLYLLYLLLCIFFFFNDKKGMSTYGTVSDYRGVTPTVHPNEEQEIPPGTLSTIGLFTASIPTQSNDNCTLQYTGQDTPTFGTWITPTAPNYEFITNGRSSFTFTQAGTYLITCQKEVETLGGGVVHGIYVEFDSALASGVAALGRAQLEQFTNFTHAMSISGTVQLSQADIGKSIRVRIVRTGGGDWSSDPSDLGTPFLMITKLN